jgi:O-antigen ligase
VGLTILYGYALYTNAGFEKIDASIFENILNYKNQIGIVTALAGLCCAWMISENRRILFSIVGLALSLFVSFVLSQSATSIVIVVVGLFSFFIALSTQWMRKSAVLKYYMFLSLAFCAFFAYWIFDFDQIFQSLDRDSTLTGRTDIWRQGYLLIADRPIFGYGYEILEGETLVSVVSGTFVPHLHNSWLNITLQFGVAGVLLHLVAYISIAKRGLAVLKSFEFKLGALVVAMLCMLLVHSTVESSFMMSRGVLSFLTFVLLLTPLNSRNSLR